MATETQAVTKKTYTPEQAWEVGLPSVDAIDLLKTLADKLVGTPFLPRALVRDGINPQATMLAIMLTGREMGLSPMEAVRSFYLAPGGQLGLYYTAMLAIMLRKGFKVKWDIDTATQAQGLFTRPDGQFYLAQFTIEQAKRAGLVRPDSNWIKYPENMLRARCTANAWRLLAGDLAGGATLYAKEELDDLYSGGNIVDAEPEPEFKVGRTTTEDKPFVVVVPEENKPEVKIEVRPEPVVEPDLAEQFTARLDAIREKVHQSDKRLAVGSINARINGFFKEYLSVKVLPHDPKILVKPLEALELIAKDQTKWAGFMADPAGAAKQDRVGLDQMFQQWGWSASTAGAAKQVMAKRGMPADQFVSWVSGALKLDHRGDDDTLAFFALANCTEDAYRALAIADGMQVPVTEVLHRIEERLPGGSLVDATEEDFTAAFDQLEGPEGELFGGSK